MRKDIPRPLFFDGAFGTYYHKISGKNAFCENANLNERETVVGIHREYIQAGARAIKTNTFGANSLLSADRQAVAEIIKNGYFLACQAAADTGALVFADIGCITGEEEAISREYKELTQLFLSLGAKNFLFETMPALSALIPALRQIRQACPDACWIVSFAVSQDGYTTKGSFYKDLIAAAVKDPDIDAVGINCLCGPSHALSLIKELDIRGKAFSAMPNAGYPTTINGRTVYQEDSAYFSEKLREIRALGVEILGGCCGTTPAHIRAAIARIAEEADAPYYAQPADAKEEQRPAFQSDLQRRFDSGRKLIAVELDPPPDTRFDYLIPAAKKAGQTGADVITVADSPLARARADSILTAAKLKREAGIDVLPHLSCRDRNHIGIKAALIGAYMEDIHNIFAITGDPVAETERGMSRGVFSFNAYNLLSFINSLNTELFSQAPFFAGAALNVNAANFDAELMRAHRKLKNGAQFLMTQALFMPRAAENLIHAKKELGCRILAGIMPVAGYKNALFLNNEVAGIEIPQSVIESFRDKPAPQVQALSVAYSIGIIDSVYDHCDGFYLMTPLKKIDLVCSLIEAIRSREK